MSEDNKPIELTEDHLKKIFGSSAGSWYSTLWPLMKKYDITTVYRIAMFFGNISVESNNFKTLEENLNYSADGLRKTFPSKFKNVSAESYARNPQKIANYVYANKIGNGSEASGDGWKYRGRGLIQLTGKANVANFHRKESSYNAINNPDVLLSKPGACASACWFWGDKGLNRQADAGNWSVCVKRINAASLHMEQRTSMYKRALSVLLGKEVKDVEELPESTESSTEAGTPDSRTSSINEPRGRAKPEYPHNKVYQSPSGHCVEFDDTPGYERIMIFHISGSFIEMHTDGDIVIKAHKDLYLLANGSVQKLQKEDHAEVVEGQSYEKVGQKVMSNEKMTLESSDLQINSPTAVNKPMDATDITVAQLTCSAPVAQLNASSALVASALAKGSPSGKALAGLSNSIKINSEKSPTSSGSSGSGSTGSSSNSTSPNTSKTNDNSEITSGGEVINDDAKGWDKLLDTSDALDWDEITKSIDIDPLINARDINARDINARDINARDVVAGNLKCNAEVAELNAATAEEFKPGTQAHIEFSKLTSTINIKNVGLPSKQVELDSPLNTAPGLIVPALDTMPDSYQGLFVFNDMPYLGMGDKIYSLGAPTPTDGGTTSG